MRTWYRKLQFGQKVLFVLLLMILLPVFALSFLEFYYFNYILTNKTNDYLKNLASVTLSKIESTVSDIENVAFYINGNDIVQASLKREETVLSDRQEYYVLYRDIRDVLASYALFRQEINAINLRSETGKEYAYTKTRYGKRLDITDYIRNENQYWTIAEDHIILVKKLFAYPVRESLGYIMLDVSRDSMYNVISDIELSGDGKVFLVNEEGSILVSEPAGLTGVPLDEPYRNCFGAEEAFYSDIVVDQKHYSIYNSRPTEAGWHMMLAIPRDYYAAGIGELRNMVFLITLMTAAIAALLSFMISKSITKPIRSLSQAMEAFGQGNFEINCVVEAEDEIGRLSSTFNQMVSDMNELVNNVYEQQMMKQEAQMKSLQMQINPHFLYNTLDTINWLARIRQADEIGDMAAALGNMMRYSLSNRSFVTIREEVKNLHDYLAIQNQRYGDKMEARIEIGEELMGFYVPKLLIQPLLENAIVHGMEEKLDRGVIIITAWQEGDDLYVQVADDGVGMTEETIAQLLNEDYSVKKKGHTSIGIVNVSRRIQMIYGTGYGLQIQSILGAGTRMTIHIRALTEEPDAIKYD